MDKKTVKFSAKIDEDIHTEFKTTCAHNKTTMQNVAQRLMAQYVDDNKAMQKWQQKATERFSEKKEGKNEKPTD